MLGQEPVHSQFRLAGLLGGLAGAFDYIVSLTFCRVPLKLLVQMVFYLGIFVYIDICCLTSKKTQFLLMPLSINFNLFHAVCPQFGPPKIIGHVEAKKWNIVTVVFAQLCVCVWSCIMKAAVQKPGICYYVPIPFSFFFLKKKSAYVLLHWPCPLLCITDNYCASIN